jgi:hypothetical protein
MKRIVRYLAWNALALAIRLRRHDLLASLYSRVVEELLPDGTVRRVQGPYSGTLPTILVLSHEQFLSDIEILAASGQVRILRLAERWQTRLMFQFYPLEVGQEGYRQFFNPTPDEVTWRPKQLYRAFLREFLPPLLDRIGVDMVVGHHIHYVPDFDWGAIADQLGYPFVVVNRENLLVTRFHKTYVPRRIERLGKFEGRVVSVHNSVAQEIFSGSGFVDAEKLRILGCIRMDRFLKSEMDLKIPDANRKNVTFFAFFPGGITLDLEGILPVYKEVYITLIEMCMHHPEIDITFKVKPSSTTSWNSLFKSTFPEYIGVFDRIPNLHLSTTIPAHELISRSPVIVSLNSTTILEAAVAGRHVVVPYYGPLRSEKYDDRIYFRDDLDLFQVPDNVDDFRQMILDGFEDPTIPKERMTRINSLFERYVSPLDGSATAKHVELFQNLRDSSKRGRAVLT